MKMNAVPALLALLTFASAAMADTLRCGGARADIFLVGKGRYGYSAATLKMSTGNRQMHRRYEYVWLNFACLTNPAGRQLLVYQAYCGGPRCNDQHDWGIVDPVSLKVLLEPAAGNRRKAEAIFGGPLEPL